MVEVHMNNEEIFILWCSLYNAQVSSPLNISPVDHKNKMLTALCANSTKWVWLPSQAVNKRLGHKVLAQFYGRVAASHQSLSSNWSEALAIFLCDFHGKHLWGISLSLISSCTPACTETNSSRCYWSNKYCTSWRIPANFLVLIRSCIILP